MHFDQADGQSKPAPARPDTQVRSHGTADPPAHNAPAYTSITKATYCHPCQVETYVKSDIRHGDPAPCAQHVRELPGENDLIFCS